VRRLRAAVLLAVVATLLAGCQAHFGTTVEIDRKGRGTVELNLTLDRPAQAALGLGQAPSPEGVAERFEPLLVEGGWTGDDAGPIDAGLDDRTGEVVLSTRHEFDSVRQLEAIMRQNRPIVAIAPDRATLGALPGLPNAAPLLNAWQFRLGKETGDNPGFELFARGGVGEIGSETCQGDDVGGFGRTLREALSLAYRITLPGGPGSTNADDTPGGDNLWRFRYQDCPALQASSGGGGSSTLVNGVILAGLSGFILMVFLLRGLRRRRERRAG
jgi:hypothetical protein